MSIFFRVFFGNAKTLVEILQETGAKYRAEGSTHILTWEDEGITLRMFETRGGGNNTEVSPTKLSLKLQGKVFDRVVKTLSGHFPKSIEVKEESAYFRLVNNILNTDGAVILTKIK